MFKKLPVAAFVSLSVASASSFAVANSLSDNFVTVKNPASTDYVDMKVSLLGRELLALINNISTGTTGATGATGPTGATGATGLGIATLGDW